jgi:hypothetical protein
MNNLISRLEKINPNLSNKVKVPRKQIKELDIFFTKHILSPYLKSVFDNLTTIGN